MERAPGSHKGENGKIAVIGGSAGMHGAPLLCALAAEAGGADLFYVAVPRCHAEAAKQASLNFQVYPFLGDDLADADVDALLRMLATVDAAAIGPGLARTEASLKALRMLLESATCPLVVDASALQPWTLEAVAGKGAVLTPHLGELERMQVPPEGVTEAAMEFRCTLHVKGPVDLVAAEDGSVREIMGGNAGLTVGGTGDALCGLIASLRAQGMAPTEACARASLAIKSAGETLARTRGYAYTARDVIAILPETLHAIA